MTPTNALSAARRDSWTHDSAASVFERIAQEHEQRLAVCSAQHRVTYGALNALANQIAFAILDRVTDHSQQMRVAVLLEQDRKSVV